MSTRNSKISWRKRALAFAAAGVVVSLAGFGAAARHRSNAEAAGPITEVFVSSTDGLIRKVIVSGPSTGTATIVGRTPNLCADSLLFEPAGNLIVTGLCHPNIYRIDPALPGGASNLGVQVNTSPLDSGAADPALHPSGTKVFVTSFSNSADEVDLATGAVTLHPLAGMTNSSGVAFDASGNLWITDYSAGSVGIANVVANTYTPLCTGLPQSDGLSYDASTGKLYVSGQSTNKIRQLTIGPSSCSVSGTWDVPNQPDGIAADGTGGVYAAGQNGTLLWLDTSNGSLTTLITGVPSLDDIAPVMGVGAPGGNPPVESPTEAAVATPCIQGIENSRCPKNPPVSKVTPAPTATAVPPTAVPPTQAPAPAPTRAGGGAAGVISAPDTGSGPGGSGAPTTALLMAATLLLAGGATASAAALRRR